MTIKDLSLYLLTGCIGSTLFCSIFSLQWIILKIDPVLVAYIPPIIVGFLSGLLLNFFKIRLIKEAVSKEKDKMKTVREIVGAVCHEANQPLQAVLGNLELILLDTEVKSKMRDQIIATIKEVNRISEITKKLEQINKYKTKKYLSTEIVDINKSSSAKYFMKKVIIIESEHFKKRPIDLPINSQS